MKQANLDFNYEICKQLNDAYRHLHNDPYAMLGDLHYFFYFSPSNFELYGLLVNIYDKSIMDTWKTGLQLKISDIFISLWEAMRIHGFYHKRFRNKQMEKALAFYR